MNRKVSLGYVLVFFAGWLCGDLLWGRAVAQDADFARIDSAQVEAWRDALAELAVCHSLDEPVISGLCRDGQRIEIMLGAHGEVYWRKVQPKPEEK